MNQNSSSNDNEKLQPYKYLLEALQSSDQSTKRFDMSSIKLLGTGTHSVIFSFFHLLFKRRVAIKIGKTYEDNVNLINDLVKMKSLDNHNFLQVLEYYTILEKNNFFLVLVMEQRLMPLEDSFNSSSKDNEQLRPYMYHIDILKSSQWCEKRFDMSSIQIIGCGAHGVVLSVFHLKYSREVVIKIGMKKNDNVSLINELVKMKSLKHPNILQVLEHKAILQGNLFFLVLVMEQGLMSLDDYLKKNPKGFKEEELFRAMRSLSSAISYAHENKITHCDLKTRNVILFPNEANSGFCFRISDFGSAYEFAEYDQKFISIKPDMDFSPLFCAPEINLIGDQEKGKANFFAGDVYSLGAIWICCTGILTSAIGCLSFAKVKETFDKSLNDLMCEVEKKGFSKHTQEKIKGIVAFNCDERVLPLENARDFEAELNL